MTYDQTIDGAETSVTFTGSAGLDEKAFAAWGEGRVAYVKPMNADEVRRLFPQAPALAPDLELFALLSASGAPILLTDSRDTAYANAWAHDLHTVSLN